MRSSYNYGFNGKEKDDDIAGTTGAVYDYGFRVYDARICRWLTLDPSMTKYPHLTPYNAFENNPIVFKDPDGKDGIISIKGNSITVSATIYIWGKDATQKAASDVQKQIMGAWGKNGSKEWTYTDDGGQVYNVKFDISVKLYGNKEKSDPFLISESWNPKNRDNFIEVDNGKVKALFEKEGQLAYVQGGDEGLWSTDPLLLNAVAHEFGHLFGLMDRYDENGNQMRGWENNIMSSAVTQRDSKGKVVSYTIGNVEQRNVDAVLKEAMDKHKKAKDKDKEEKIEVDKTGCNM